MLLIFFDEVKTQPDYPFYHIRGICIDEEHITLIEYISPVHTFTYKLTCISDFLDFLLPASGSTRLRDQLK